MTTKDNQFALELFVANHNANSEDQLKIIENTLNTPKTVAILATTNGKIRKTACLPTITFGFQLYDLVMFDDHFYYIKSRRSSGSFALTSVDGLKDENRSYKKLTLLAHTNAYLTNRYVNA